MSISCLSHPVRLSIVLLTFVCTLDNSHAQLLRFEMSSPAMGSHVDMVVYAENESLAKIQIECGLAEIDRLSAILSNYDSSSEISKLCTSPIGKAIAISQDLASVLRHSQDWHRLSDGGFDITVGPLTSLWRVSRKQKRLPNVVDIEEAKMRCGWDGVQFDATNRVALLRAEMMLDLSGIAVGYIVDKAFEKMIDNGTKHVLINAGGDIRVGDSPPNADGWRVTIAGLGKESPPLAKLSLSNCAITTSGDLNQFIEIDGRRYSHFIDPKTGNPIERRQSATAIAANTVDADAGATALAVLGSTRASELFDAMPLREAILVQSDAQNSELVHLRRLSRQ